MTYRVSWGEKHTIGNYPWTRIAVADAEGNPVWMARGAAYADGVAAEMVAAILNDMQAGVLPQDVGSFEELHDHADANGYYPVRIARCVPAPSALEQMNVAAAEVDRWLRERAKTRKV